VDRLSKHVLVIDTQLLSLFDWPTRNWNADPPIRNNGSKRRFGCGHGPWSHYTQGLVILKYPALFPVSDIWWRCGCSGYARTRERPPDRSFCEPML